MSVSTLTSLNRLFWMAAASAIIMLAVVTGLRTHSALKAIDSAPGVHITSGCEEESMFAIWRQSHGEPVYFDSSRPPYSSAYFNWLFYRTYGLVAPSGSSAESGAALIRNGRLLTLAGALCGALLLGSLSWKLTERQPPHVRMTGVAAAAFACLGPLPGWWIITLRPDIWAATLECAGLLGVIALWRRSPATTAVVAALCFYAAWAFKQNFVQGLAIALLFLLCRRQWKTAAGLLGLSVTGWAATLILLGPDYRAALLSTAATSHYSLSLGIQSLIASAVRCLPLVAAAACLPFLRTPEDESPLIRDSRQLALIGLPLSLAFSFMTSCKLGAALNYYFSPMVLLAVLALVAMTRSKAVLPATFALLGITALCGWLFLFGSLHLRASLAAQTRARWELLQHAPSPRFADDQPLNLPWLNPGQPAYLTAFHYADDRGRGRKFLHDGIGGLIQQRYFAALLLPDHITDTYDHASLSGYQRGASAGGNTLWLRTPLSSNP